MEIIKILMLIIAVNISSTNSNNTIKEYSYIKYDTHCGNDTIICKKETPIGEILTRIVIKHQLGDMDTIYTYPDSIGYTIRK